MQNDNNSSVQNNSRLKSCFFCFCCFFFLKDDRPQVYALLMPFFFFLNEHFCSNVLQSNKKKNQKMLQKQRKEDGVRLFYNNFSASCLYWFIFRNNTLRLFLVPYPFKIEASLQNSLRLQCTYLCIFNISQCKKEHRPTGFL